MADGPLCQFGPGGDYTYTWPESERAYVTASGEVMGEPAASEAARLGLEPPLVSIGPGALRWAEGPLGRQSDRGGLAFFRSDAVIEPDRLSSVLGRALGALGRMLIGNGLPRQQVLAGGSAPIEEVAMSGRQQAKVLSEKPFTVVALNTSQENANDNCTFEKPDGNAATTGNTEVHTRFSYSLRLFPDDAGNWGSLGFDQSNRVRTRSRSGKKRSAASGRKAQGSLFTDF